MECGRLSAAQSVVPYTMKISLTALRHGLTYSSMHKRTESQHVSIKKEETPLALRYMQASPGEPLTSILEVPTFDYCIKIRIAFRIIVYSHPHDVDKALLRPLENQDPTKPCVFATSMPTLALSTTIHTQAQSAGSPISWMYFTLLGHLEEHRIVRLETHWKSLDSP